MNGISPLTIGLIENRPLTAVRALAAMDPRDAAAFCETLPRRHAVAVFSRMSAWSASTVIPRMTPVSGAAILSELDYQTTASIMRVIPAADREKLLSALPKKLSGDLRSTLTYPDDTVGAKMSTAIVVMAADQTVGDAVAELRQIKRAKTGVAFVVDETRKLLGVVNAYELLQRSNESRLSQVMDRSVKPLSARARLSTVESLPAWDDYAHMPVVNRQKILIGALARRTFRQPTVQTAPSAARAQTPSIIASMASAFFAGGVGLARVLTDVEVKPDMPITTRSQRRAGDNS
ncbi:MAG: magnesium transporter MgtE N-terminal domain-containing protein [Inquilinaceae bacterium]